MPRHPGRTALYRLFDEADRLLYVGISHNPDVRWGQHSTTKSWWPEVQRRAVEWHDTRVAAAEAEKGAIVAERPAHNDVHTVRPPRPRMPQDKSNHTPLRPLRIPDDEWEALGQAVGERNRTRLIREYIRWHLRWPGNTQPARAPEQTGGPGISSKGKEENGGQE